jgi:hypothetical protein
VIIGFLSITQLICSLVILRIYVKSRRGTDAVITDYLSDMHITMESIETILHDIRNAVER